MSLTAEQSLKRDELRLDMLQRRRDYLARQLQGSEYCTWTPHYVKRELAAIKWAIRLAKKNIEQRKRNLKIVD